MGCLFVAANVVSGSSMPPFLAHLPYCGCYITVISEILIGTGRHHCLLPDTHLHVPVLLVTTRGNPEVAHEILEVFGITVKLL